MTTKKFAVTGMTCASCSANVEKSVKKVPGVRDARVSLLTNAMRVDYDPARTNDEAIVAAVVKAGYGANVAGESPKAAPARENSVKTRLIASVALLIPLMYVSMGHMLGLPLPPWLHGAGNEVAFAFTQLLLTLPVVYINRNYFINGFRALRHGAPNMDTLISLGSGAALLYGVVKIYEIAYYAGHGMSENAAGASMELYFESAAMILTLITVGKFLESRSKDRTGDAIRALAKLAPDTARVERDGAEREIPLSELRVGDLCLVRPGGAIPADGTVEEGSGAIDQSALTGESVPVEARPGSAVRAGTLNRAGFLKIRVERTGDDTTLSQVIRLVEEAGASKAPVARLADRISGVFVPVVLGIACISFAAWLIAGQSAAFAWNAFISVLVVSCPCALGLATPVAIMAGTGRAAQFGVLFKNAEALERAHSVNAAVLDKTGTLTEGKLRVTNLFAPDEARLLTVAASLEAASEHPLAEAVLAAARERNIAPRPVADFSAVPGRGIRAVMDGENVLAGNEAMLREAGVFVSNDMRDAAARFASDGATPMFAALNGVALGVLAAADTPRADSAYAIEQLHALGVKTVMLTGDNRVAAEAVAKRLGVDEVVAEALPQDKERAVRRLRDEGLVVAMVGDGINDAPALKRADVGIAVGAGTDIAMDSADAVLMRGGVTGVASAIRLSRAVMRNIRENLFWAFFYNALGIPLAAGVFYPLLGWRMNPMFGAAAMSLSSVCVVLNALRLTRLRDPAAACPVPDISEPHQEKEESIPMKKEISIEGMMCAHCVAHVEKALNAIEGVHAEVSLEKKNATVTMTAPVSDEALKQAVEDAGYTVTGIRA